MGLTATVAATLTGISVRSINSLYLKLRSRIAASCEQLSPLQGAIEVDESYIGPCRVRGKRARGAHDKTIVFGLLKEKVESVPRSYPTVPKPHCKRYTGAYSTRCGDSLGRLAWHDGLVSTYI